MKIDKILTAAALPALLFASASAGAVDTLQNVALPVPANRIVGLWVTEGATRPCGSSLPAIITRNTLLFHAGGTVTENTRFSPGGAANVSGVTGVNQRSGGLGTWSFDRQSRRYTLHLRFDWYVDGAYHGYSTVDRELTLSKDGLQATGTVQSTRFAANGNTVVAVCGTAVSDRL